MTKRINRLFYDIETSPNVCLSWRVGHKINLDHSNILKERAIICICYKWEHEKTVHSLTWDENQCDRAMLLKFMAVAELADEMVGHNGDRFDLPWIKTRCIFHGIPTFPDYKTIDTLQWARRKFYFNSNRLDYLGQFLGVGGKIKTEFGLWKKIVLEKSASALNEMVRYCKRDVLMLQEVYRRLEAHVPHKTHVGVASGLDRWTSPFNGGTNVQLRGTQTTKMGTTTYRMQCKDTGRWYSISALSLSAYRQWKKDKEDNAKKGKAARP